MVIVGEKINTSLKGVTEAVIARDEEFISNLAKYQADFGANYIDVNCGTLIDEEVKALPWLVETVQKTVNLPCCIDSPNPEALEAALEIHKGVPMINSITNENERYEKIIPLVKKYKGKIVSLVIDDEFGMPKTSEIRIKVGLDLIKRLNDDGIACEDIFMDPLIQPISSSQDMGVIAIDTIKGIIQEKPKVHFMCGLSNISYGLPKRGILNSTFLTLCIMAGLDGAILDPGNKRMMAMIYSAEALLNRDKFTKKYLKAFRQGLLDF